MASNTTASINKLSCTNYVDSGKLNDRFGIFPGLKTTPTSIILEINVVKEIANEDYRLVENTTILQKSTKKYLRQSQ